MAWLHPDHGQGGWAPLTPAAPPASQHPHTGPPPPPPQLELPTDLELLPGHIFQMEEALRRERENRCGAQRGGAAAAPP